MRLVPREHAEDAEWAYVAARLGWTPDQWDGITQAQRVLLSRAIEDRDAEEAETLRDAVANALANAMAKRGSRAVKLYEDLTATRRMSPSQARRKMRDIQAHIDGR